MRGPITVSNTRRGALAAVLILLSLIAHAAAAGSMPQAEAILGGAVVAGALAWSLAGSRRSMTSLVLILFAGQLLIHAVVVALGHHGVAYLPGVLMTLAHLAAGGVAALLFAHGEKLVATWRRASAWILGAPRLVACAIPSRPAGVLLRARPLLFADVGHVDVHPNRGPPTSFGAPTFA